MSLGTSICLKMAEVSAEALTLHSPDWQEAETDYGEYHFDEGIGAEADRAQEDKLHQLACREQMNFPLGYPPDIVSWWVCLLKYGGMSVARVRIGGWGLAPVQ